MASLGELEISLFPQHMNRHIECSLVKETGEVLCSKKDRGEREE